MLMTVNGSNHWDTGRPHTSGQDMEMDYIDVKTPSSIGELNTVRHVDHVRGSRGTVKKYHLVAPFRLSPAQTAHVGGDASRSPEIVHVMTDQHWRRGLGELVNPVHRSPGQPPGLGWGGCRVAGLK